MGSKSGQVPPAWKSSQAQSRSKGGSKVLISDLPTDVLPRDIRELMEETVGGLKDLVCVYNAAAKFIGVAIVEFHEAQHAETAKRMYDKKIMDHERIIKVEIVGGDAVRRSSVPQPPAPRSLLERLGTPISNQPSDHIHGLRKSIEKLDGHYYRPAQALRTARPYDNAIPNRVMLSTSRQKKGPRRLKKPFGRRNTTVADLDAELEAYRKAAPVDDRFA